MKVGPFKLIGSRWVPWARGQIVLYLGSNVFLYPDGRFVDFVHLPELSLEEVAE